MSVRTSRTDVNDGSTRDPVGAVATILGPMLGKRQNLTLSVALTTHTGSIPAVDPLAPLNSVQTSTTVAA